MGAVRLGVLGCVVGATIIACGLEVGGPGADLDSGDPDVVTADGMDVVVLPDASMDIMTPDLGTGETEAGIACTCTPVVPNGWSVVEYSSKARPPCGTYFNSPADVTEVASVAPPVCSCTCNSTPTTQPTCSGNITFSFGNASNCATTHTTTVTAGTTCTAGPFVFTATSNNLDNFSIKNANGPNPAGGQCAGAVTPTKSGGAITTDQGRTCNPAAAPGSCGQGLCVPTPAAPYGICVAASGTQNACPAGWPNKHFIGTGNPIDQRVCNANQGCTLTSAGTCSKPIVSLFQQSDTTCGSSAQFGPYAADDTCRNPSYGNGITFGAARYSSSISGATCGYTGTCTSSGAVVPNNPITVCCL